LKIAHAEVATGNAPLIMKLKHLGIVPLLKPHFQQALNKDKSEGVSKWDRMTVRLAVAHLLTWESWNHRTRKEYQDLIKERSAILEEVKPLSKHFVELRTYESARHKQLKEIAFADDERPFTIGSRMIRSWPRVQEMWQKSGNTLENRKKILADLQTKLKGKFGDPDLFNWLAADGREHLWNDADPVTALVKINIADRLLQNRKEYSLMTFADARIHPRWCMYEAPGGSNLRNYELKKVNSDLKLKIALLERQPDSTLCESSFEVFLAPSGQLANLSEEKVDGVQKKLKFSYSSSHQQYSGEPGGAEILFDRPFMEHKSDESIIESGNPGPVWFKLTINVDYLGPKEWLDGRGKIQTPPSVHHFNSGLAKKSKHTSLLEPGLRVMSVDLGLRTFASCSVFELVKGKPKAGLCYPAADGKNDSDPAKLWAKHERSFKLSLPGEDVSKEAIAKRR